MKKDTRILRAGGKVGDEQIIEAARILREGGTVAFPTETVYGLGADALNEKAVSRIFKAKGRPADNPLIVHVGSKERCMELARNIPEKALLLMDEFWPGPLTLIMERKSIVPDVTTGGLDTVALRMPENEIALELIRQSGKPIAAPSANLSGRPSPTTAEHVLSDLCGRIDAVVDGGEVSIGLESTVVDMTGDTPCILRPGKITKEELEACIGDVRIAYDDKVHPESEIVRSPGMKYTHYSPDSIVILVEGENDAVISRMKELISDFHSRGANVGLLLTDESKRILPVEMTYSLGEKDRPEQAAKNLFSGLRYLDERKADIIIVDGSFYPDGIGKAVFNRVRKAADMIIKV
ncbi:L-threonylcarbamoyladenylate synthase [Methanolobus sp. WCC5]|uniref:L-threonylcarbamoyladenylate synthase n=1 Tax=Methanolobus sp. WCC5 TaxID=3125785 RepID=UPI003249FF93